MLMDKKNEKVIAEKIFNQKGKDSQQRSTKTGTSRQVFIFIFGCVLGAFVMSLFSGGTTPVVKKTFDTTNTSLGNNATTSASTSLTSTSTTSAKSGIATGSVASGVSSGTVSVNNQPAGNSVIVESVTVPPPGVWVAVQETRGNKLGNVLGATRVHGPLSNIVVSLLRNTEPNREYAVVLYRDGGDGGVFDLKVDSVYVDFDSGERVSVPFRTTGATSSTNI